MASLCSLRGALPHSRSIGREESGVRHAAMYCGRVSHALLLGTGKSGRMVALCSFRVALPPSRSIGRNESGVRQTTMTGGW